MKKRPDPTKVLQKVNSKLVKRPPQFPDFKVGDTVRVYVKVKEGEKTRIQPYEGIVIKRKRAGVKSTFTVRKISSGGIGVERIFPYYSPIIDRILLVSQGEVRRAKLYYLRGLRGRAGRIKSEYVYQDTIMESAESSEKADSSAEVKTEKESADQPDVSAKAARA